ncbi:MAG: ABC transporter ATP-binding protein [Clostridia bacterium]|nr:ABC transporter ATP-binding protein [Clostridia bacterium]
MKEVLRFENVSMHYHSKQGETVAVEDLDFSVNEGEFVAIIGPSGCGKTTLLSLAAGLLPPTAGEVKTNGCSFGYMLQKDELFPWRTIEKNIFLPLEIKRTNTPEHRERALALAEKYGLKQFLKNYPSSLSGGMRQRAALIRTLAVDPDVLLLDEPFSALDYQTRLSVCDDVYKIIRSEKKTALLITHDISEAISVADRIFVLSRRPARVVASHEISFPDSEPLKRRENKEFSKWFELLWKELNV